jgi:hypothetical protein
VTAAGSIWRSLAELQAAQVAFQRDWWRDDPGAREQVEARAELSGRFFRMSLVSTTNVYKVQGDRWCPERSAIHERLVDAQVGKGVSPERPTAYFTIGGMASGKSSRLRPIVHQYRAFRTGEDPSSLSRIDADEIRQELPEYRDGRGSLVVQQECFDVTYDMVFPAALDARMDIVYDTIGTFGPTNDISFKI